MGVWIMNRDKIIDKLQSKLTEKRLLHSIGVEFTAASMAMVYGVDIEKARMAGLLHDCAKGLSAKEKIEKAKKHGISISDYEEKNPEMLHAKLGAYYAKTKYGVLDEDVLNAITYHTTGRPDMSLLEKIIFVADYIEPGRKMLDELPEIRKEAFSDIDKCVIHILKNTIAYLKEIADDMDITTQETYDFYCGLSK